MQRIFIMRSKLSESHVGTLRQLRYTSYARKEPTLAKTKTTLKSIKIDTCYTHTQKNSLEHRLHGDNGVAIGQTVLLGRVRQLLVDDHHVLRQRDASAQQIVKTIDRALHPVNEREIRDGVQEGDVRPTFQQQNDRI